MCIKLIAWLRVATEIIDEIFLASDFWMVATDGKDSKTAPVLLHIQLVCAVK